MRGVLKEYYMENINNWEVLFSKMRLEYLKLKDEYPSLTGFEVANYVLNDIHLYVNASVNAEYAAKKLFQFWVRGNL